MACLYIIYYFFSNASFFCRTFRRPVEVLPAGPFVVCGIRAKAGRLDHVDDPPFTDPGRDPIPEISLHKGPFHKASVHLTDHGDQTVTVSGTLLNETDQSFSGTLFATAYNAEGRMIGTSLSQVIALPAGSSVPVSTPIQLSENWLSGCTVKLLYLEETDLCPLVEHALYGA